MLALLLAVAGCTSYTAETPVLTGLGGYTQEQGPGDLVKVMYNGPQHGLRLSAAAAYTLYRCAEVSQRAGKPFFALYQDLPAALQDKRSNLPLASPVMGRAFAHAYIRMHDTPGPGLLSTSEVLARLAPLIKESGN